jgi:hypothetical protein
VAGASAISTVLERTSGLIFVVRLQRTAPYDCLKETKHDQLIGIPPVSMATRQSSVRLNRIITQNIASVAAYGDHANECKLYSVIALGCRRWSAAAIEHSGSSSIT